MWVIDYMDNVSKRFERLILLNLSHLFVTVNVVESLKLNFLRNLFCELHPNHFNQIYQHSVFIEIFRETFGNSY